MKKVFFVFTVIVILLCQISVCALAHSNEFVEADETIDGLETNPTLWKAFEGFSDFERYDEFGFSTENDFKEWLGKTTELTASSNSIILNHNNAVLQVGKTLQLTATTVPAGKAIRWTVIQNDLASVTPSGLVTAKAVGDAYIIASCDELDLNVACHIKILDVALNSTLTVSYGDRGDLSAYVKPSSESFNISWQSLTSGFQVTPGMESTSVYVSYSGVGNGLIKAYITEHPEIYSICTVKYVPKIRLSKISASVFKGDTLSLTATVTPSQYNSVTWTSLNPAIATVSSTGVVTAKSAGRARIKATVNGYSDAFALCLVTVKEKIPVTSISLPKTLDLTCGTQYQFNPAITPSNATNQEIDWSTSGSATVVVDRNGLITAYAAGETVVTAKSRENGNIVARCTVISRPSSATDTVTKGLIFSISVSEAGHVGVFANSVTVTVAHELMYMNQPFEEYPFDMLDRGTYVQSNIMCLIIQNAPSMHNPPVISANVSISGEHASYTNGIDSYSSSGPFSSNSLPYWHSHMSVSYFKRCGAWVNFSKLNSRNPITVTYGAVVSAENAILPRTIEQTYTFTPDIPSSLYN